MPLVGDETKGDEQSLSPMEMDQTKTEKTEEKEVQKGTNIEDLEKKISNLEEQVRNSRATIQAQTDVLQHTVEKKKDIYEQLGDEFFLNPAEALRKQAALIEKERLEKEVQRKQADNFWKDFYEKNPKLKSIDFVIQDHVNINLTNWKNVPIDEFAKKVEEYGKKILKNVRGSGGDEETINSSKSQSFSSGGGRTVPPPTREQALSFTEQIKHLQKKK